MELTLPENLVAYAKPRGRTAWLEALPEYVADARVGLGLDWIGEPFQPGGMTAWVAPVRSATHGYAVLKLACRHEEAEDEAAGLECWAGSGAVALLHAEQVDERTVLLLLERLVPGEWLLHEPPARQDEVIAGLLTRLWIEPPAQPSFRSLTTLCDFWAERCERWAQRLGKEQDAGRAPGGPVDPGLIRAGIELFRSLPREPAEQRLLCTDLHAENVLSARREPWLMVDPKPYVGDPSFDLLQHILNGAARFGREPRALCRRMAALTGQDPRRVELWLFARCVAGAPHWPELLEVAAAVAPAQRRSPTGVGSIASASSVATSATRRPAPVDCTPSSSITVQ